MNAPDRGLKHVCPACATKYYDMKKELIVCPKCGAKPRAGRLPRATHTTRKTGRTTFGRFP